MQRDANGKQLLPALSRCYGASFHADKAPASPGHSALNEAEMIVIVAHNSEGVNQHRNIYICRLLTTGEGFAFAFKRLRARPLHVVKDRSVSRRAIRPILL